MSYNVIDENKLTVHAKKNSYLPLELHTKITSADMLHNAPDMDSMHQLPVGKENVLFQRNRLNDCCMQGKQMIAGRIK